MVDPCFTVCSEHMVYFSRAFATAGSDFSDLKRPRPLVSINYTKNAVANLHHCLQHGTNEASQSLEIRMQLDGKIFDPRSASFAHNSCVPVLLVLYYLQYTVQCRAEDFLLDYKFWKSSFLFGSILDSSLALAADSLLSTHAAPPELKEPASGRPWISGVQCDHSGHLFVTVDLAL